MYMISWSKDIETGIKLIDDQHRKLFKAANNFFIKYYFQKQKEAAKECLNFFENYIEYHFQAEEAFQRENKYPDANEHQAIHAMLSIQFKRLSLTLNSTDYSEEALNELYIFVSTFVTEHIKMEDMKFALFLKALD